MQCSLSVGSAGVRRPNSKLNQPEEGDASDDIRIESSRRVIAITIV